jgi:Ig-like domain from next to BRCA1 gene
MIGKLSKKWSRTWSRKLAFLTLFGLAACSGFPFSGRTPVSFLPPTLPPDVTPQFLAQPTPAVTEQIVEQRPTPTPDCTDILSFLEDQSIPDGTVVRPGEVLDKRWLVANSGTCNWDQRYRVKLLSGPVMGAELEQALYPARSGTQFTIRMQLAAPQEAGVYRSAWQAAGPQGQLFGDPFFIEVIVEPQSP